MFLFYQKIGNLIQGFHKFSHSRLIDKLYRITLVRQRSNAVSI